MGSSNVLFLLFCLSLSPLEGLVEAWRGPHLEPLPLYHRVNDGDLTFLECPVTDAQGGENVEWYHEGAVISYGPRLLRNRSGVYTLDVIQDLSKPSVFHWIIVINKVNASRDVGTWSCKLEGPLDQEVSTELIEGAVKLSEGIANETSISATWEIPNDEVDAFNITCTSGTASPASISLTNISHVGQTLLAYCTDLPTPGVQYNLYVVSITSDKVMYTKTAVMFALPQTVVLTEERNEVTTTSITTTWSRPEGGVEYFQVSCSDGSPSPAQVDQSGELEASCVNLPIPGEDYNVSVTSVSNGLHSERDTLTITALPDAVTLTEESDAVMTTSITAAWHVPMGVVEYYEVSCPSGSPSPTRVYPLQNDLRASCTDLPTPGDDYDVVVTSVSNGQRSENSAIRITALPEPVILKGGFFFVPRISVQWVVPDSVVDAFNITCREGAASPASISVNSSDIGQTLTSYCTDLPLTGVHHWMSVVAISNGKQSDVSTAQVITYFFIVVVALPAFVIITCVVIVVLCYKRRKTGTQQPNEHETNG